MGAAVCDPHRSRPGHDARTGHAIDDLAKVDTFRFVNRTGRAELPDVVTDPSRAGRSSPHHGRRRAPTRYHLPLCVTTPHGSTVRSVNGSFNAPRC